MRAIRARYNPYLQTTGRLAQLAQLGHSIDKVGFYWMKEYIFLEILIKQNVGRIYRDGWDVYVS